MEYVTVALLIFFSYWLLIVYLNRIGFLQKFNISAIGPLLMIRTKRGKKLLERLAAAKRFWRAYAALGVVFLCVAMLFMLLLLLYGNYAVVTEKPEPTEFNEPRNWLLIPGLNEFIPVWGWIGLIVALIVHELSHAVLCRVENIDVKSMGVLIAVLPIGAFAEPDSEQLFGPRSGSGSGSGSGAGAESGVEVSKKVATPGERARILSAGVMGNFAVSIVALLMFFAVLSCMHPVSKNATVVHEVVPGSPAEKAGIREGMLIKEVGGVEVGSASEALSMLKKGEGGSVEVVVLSDGEEKEISLRTNAHGIMVANVMGGYPAEKAGIEPGMVISRIDDVEIRDLDTFLAFMRNTTPGQVVEVYVSDDAGRLWRLEVELAAAPHGGSGFLGVYVVDNAFGLTILDFPLEEYLKALKDTPLSLTSPLGWLRFMMLPLLPAPFGFSGFYPHLVKFYEAHGVLAAVAVAADAAPFLIADILFWTAWINFYAALFNCLPAVPLDGGLVFRDILKPFVRLFTRGDVEKVTNMIVTALAIFIFGSIAFIAAGPYLI